jgi:acetylornithine deacetylase/succinyl-diaminopimelate desuccinylase family protein
MDALIETLADLVRINSVNPAYPDGAPESAMAAYIQGFFEKRGVAVTQQSVFPGRPNVVATLPGRDPSARIVLEAHTDTAGISGMTIPPFEPRLENGRLYGRGACDTKAGVAAMMHAVASLAEERIQPRCEVIFAGTADEEYSYRGVVKLCEGLRADAAVVSEPTSLRLVVATKGCLRFRIRVQGKAAHSAKPHLGVNAISHMARLIVALEEDAQALDRKPHALLGPPTFNIGIIHGGSQVNIVPESCTIEIDRRLVPGEELEEVWRSYGRLVANLRDSIAGFTAVVEEPMLQDMPLETASSQPVAAVASQVLADLGLNSEAIGVPYGSDASKLARAGVPSIVFGPGTIDQAHAASEFVVCHEVHKAYAFYRRFILAF